MGLHSAIISWDNAWRFDYLFRKKYNIPFNSEEHRKMNQIDSRMDLLEEEIYKNHLENDIALNKELEELDNGNWFKPHTAENFEENLFDKIQI